MSAPKPYNKISRRDFLRLGALTMGAAALAACQQAPTEAPPASTAPVATPMVNKGGTVSVYWNAGHNYEAYQQVVAAFEKDNPGWKVNWELYQWPDMRTKLLANFTAGEVPDLVEESGWTQEFAIQGNLLSLEPYIEQHGADMGFPNDWFEAAVAKHQIQGETFGVQLHYTCNLPFANMTLLEQAGITKLPETWEEFLEVCKATTQGNVFGFAPNQAWEYAIPWFLQNGVSFYDPDKKVVPFDNEAAFEAMQFQADLIHLHKVAPIPLASADYEGPQKLFSAGRAAIILTGPWDIKPILTSSPDLNWQTFPALTRQVQSTYAAGTGMFIPKKAKNPELAFDLIRRLTAVDVEIAATKEANMLMPRKSWASNAEVQSLPRIAPFTQGLAYAEDYGKDLRLTGKSGVVLDLFKVAVEEVLYKNSPASEVMTRFAADATASCNE